MDKNKINIQSLFGKLKAKLILDLHFDENDFIKIIDSDALFNKFKDNVLSYLYMLSVEFEEVNDLINELLDYKPFEIDIANSTPTQNALNISVVISYARSFKNSFGFYNTKEINSILIRKLSIAEKELHNKILTMRDKEFAHSDASVNDIQTNVEGDYEFSKIRIRQPLEKYELLELREMVSKIREELDIQTKCLE